MKKAYNIIDHHYDVIVAGGQAVINLAIGNVLEPRLMGKELGLSALVIFISLAFWGSVLGIGGALLSVPLTVAVKIALNVREDTRWLAVLMGSHAGAREAVAVPGAAGKMEAD